MRLIDKDALMMWLDNHYDDEEVTVGFVSGLIKEQPTIEARKTGKWNFIGDQMFECTECGTCYTQSQFYQMRVRISDTEFPKFCPNCGARMEGNT